ncbi:hypothetical protein J7K43_01970 [Candidatus Calescamantes bacterium]|nr:hypothetical protein [Candidatus Calescamantes bacterium]
MTSEERIKKAFQHQEPGRVPIFEQEIASNVASGILGRYAYTGCGPCWRDVSEHLYRGERDFIVEKTAEDIVELYSLLGMDAVAVPAAPPKIDPISIKKLDEYTYRYENKETGFWSIMKYTPEIMMFSEVDSIFREEGIPAIRKLVKMNEKSLSPDESKLDIADYVIKKLGQEKAITIISDNCCWIPLEEAWLEAMVLEPELVEEYLEQQTEYVLEWIRLQSEHGIDFILGGADIADNRGPIYSPKLFRRFILPRLKRITDFAHKLGLPYVYRTDGNTWPIAQELFVESGVDGYGEIDAQAGMDIGEIKIRFPHLTLWGNVDSAKTLVSGSREEIIAEARRCIDKGAPGGGYIFGSSNTIHPGVPVENFLLMIETAKKYGI